ncbi:molybdopterin-dependent oxidoreductase [Granulosicoccaceae sp. 1_MG-2023]|nr:molybdopterin-dependent oxidoreductase [Granulosicoccaceae sp. 1_MG-2023]
MTDKFTSDGTVFGGIPVNGETRTTCPYCGVGCGVVVSPDADGNIKVRGDKAHPANFGRLCSKGTSLGETLALDDRLLHCVVDGQQSGWDTALERVATVFSETIARHGPDSVALYVSGQILTEDYYVANKLMKGFIGSANIDTNSRLCMSTAVAGHKRAFGTDTVPACYEDLEQADLLIITGSNLAWAHPVLFQRVMAAKKARPSMRVVLIDPRRTASADIADLHLAVAPGSDAVLFNGLLGWLIEHDCLDKRFIADHTSGFDALCAAQVLPSLGEVAQACHLPEDDIRRFFDWVAQTEKTVTAFSQGINQSSSGVDKVNSIINVHLATGRIGKPGASPFSITGQPNAMGGREVGGLANQLAAHMDFSPGAIDRVGRFWQARAMATKPGLKAVELFDAVRDGRIKALWIMSTNPVVSLPEADKVREALNACPFVVVSDCIAETDTSVFADVLLPAATWGEKDGTVTNSERCVSHQKAFLPLPGEARPDWWQLCEVARRMGFEAGFDYRNQADIFREHARLSGFENKDSRDFDISALQAVSDAHYQALEPFQWPLPERGQSRKRFFADGQFYTPDRRARFVPVAPRQPARPVSPAYPLICNTGRIRDQWHTMTRTAKTSRLMGHMPEPYVEIHPQDAVHYGLSDGALAEVYNQNASLTLRVKTDASQQPGSVFVPMHWTAQYASAARVDSLVNAVVDPLSGQPESKHTPVAVRPWPMRWQGFILTRRALPRLPGDYWALVRESHSLRYVIAGQDEPASWSAVVSECFGAGGNWIELEDTHRRGYRAAQLKDGRVQAVLVVAGEGEPLLHSWLNQQFGPDAGGEDGRRSLLSGRPASAVKDAGRQVCACFNVGINTIVEAIEEQQLSSVEAIGELLRAGTNCGSCKPELAAILQQRCAAASA